VSLQKLPHSGKKLKRKVYVKTKEITDICRLVKGKGKVHPITGHEGPEVGYRYSSTLSLTLALDWGGWSMPRPSCFSPEKDTVSIVQEAGWTPGLVWTGVENLTPTGICSPDRPACSKLPFVD
jgi:hypothetical protein